MNHKTKICIFDIETTGLEANFGNVICCSWKWFGENKIYTLKNTDYKSFNKTPWDDKELVRDISIELSKADILTSWYGTKFDIPFLNTRLLYHKLTPIPDIPHVDCWRIAKYQLKLTNNRLATVSAFFELEEKTPVKGFIWVKAKYGHKGSIKYIVKHCEGDVKILEEAYTILRPLCKTHPNVNLIGEETKGCPVCGSKKLEKRGTRIASSNMYQRYLCKDCNHWTRARIALKTNKPETI